MNLSQMRQISLLGSHSNTAQSTLPDPNILVDLQMHRIFLGLPKLPKAQFTAVDLPAMGLSVQLQSLWILEDLGAKFTLVLGGWESDFVEFYVF
jgi:hypothetical protein